VLHAVVIGALPQTASAYAGVALFFTSGSVAVVNSLVETLAVSEWDTLVEFFIDSLTWKAVAAGDTFLYAFVWLNLTTSLAATLAAFLVNLSSGARHGALSGCSPVGNNLPGEGALAGVGGEGGALAVGGSVAAARTGADVLLAHGDVAGWIDDSVAAAEHSFTEKRALFLGELKVFAVLGA
jgi:hypothetical protein